MKHTLSHNRQLFNVKAIAEAGLTPELIPDNTFGIIDVTTDLTVAPASFEELPKKFRAVHKINGQLFYGFDCIEKKDIVWAKAKEYKEAKQNKWEAVLKHCRCIDSVKLNIYVQDDLLNRANGLPWGTNDFYHEVSPEEFQCYCSCNEAGAYANNVLTMLLYKQILAAKPQFYTAKVETEDGTTLNTLKEIEAFVEQNKEANTDKDDANDGKLLKLIVEGLPQKKAKRLNPYNMCYTYPSGVKLLPSFLVNGATHVPFKEVQKLEFEVGDGIDLVYEEQEQRSNYMNVGSYARTHYLPEFPEYQFEESKKYDTFTLEFDTPKTLRAGEADKKRFMWVFGSEVALNADVHKKLVQIFTPA